ncbi:MAG TPA: hypothetical protein VFD52_02080 [Clostridia bacterium]|nr:hypothetical protein [Clostridia bacterium]
MKTMLKLLTLMLAFTLILTMAACAGDDDKTTTEKLQTTQTTDVAAVTTTENQITTDINENNTIDELTTEDASVVRLETKADVLNYFNTCINKVKPNSKTITQKYERNTFDGEIDLGNKFLEKLAGPLVDSNMGDLPEKKDKDLLSENDKVMFFPVEGENWSSKLTLNNIKDAKYTLKDGVYTITITLKNDKASADIGAGDANAGKALTPIAVETIYDNAGPAKSILKNVKIGYRNGKLVAQIDEKTGNVIAYNTYMDWELSLTALGLNINIEFGLEKDYKVKW